MTKKDLEKRFEGFPDVVNLTELRAMMGGIGESPVRKLLRSNRIEHFYINTTCFIPKEKVIDYLLSPHYAQYRLKLKHWVK